MKGHKKKPRQRNRPKNKANQIACETDKENINKNSENKNEIVELKMILQPKVTEELAGSAIIGAVSVTEKLTSAAIVTETDKIIATITESNKITEKVTETDETLVTDPVKEKESTEVKSIEAKSAVTTESEKTSNAETKPSPQNKLSILSLFENDSPIQLIQQLMRAKLLNKAAPQTKSSEEESKVKNQTLKSFSKPISTNANAQAIKKSKSKEKLAESEGGKGEFLANLQKQMQNVLENGPSDLPTTLLGNLQKLISQEPISDVESSDDEQEYIEYVYKPRQYFLVSLCNLCKCDLRSRQLFQCTRCKMTYYCSTEHMKSDECHRQLCHALRQVAENCGGHIFYKCADFTTEQFRSYRIVTIRKVEAIMNRPLNATEQEVILFPRICANVKCREYRFNKLMDCSNCGQLAFCKSNPEHRGRLHNLWCKPYQLFKELIMFQEKFGRLDPSLPSKILKDLPGTCCSTKQIFSKLGLDMRDQCEYAALTQISTCPLTAWYALKLCDQLKGNEVMTIHLIGAEIDFEVDLLHKWELFFLHITPCVKQLNVVFIGPELNPRNISFEQLKKTRCCRICRKNDRRVQYYFENKIYHDYCKSDAFETPHLICFFNAGLYRSTGYHLEDTWPETILAVANLNCPVVVTSYTEYEAPLDMSRFVQESNRHLNVVLPPIVNPFTSEKPERNFISDEDAPLMFKNYYCFVIE